MDYLKGYFKNGKKKTCVANVSKLERSSCVLFFPHFFDNKARLQIHSVKGIMYGIFK